MKKRIIPRLISIVLIIAMVITSSNIPVFATENISIEESNQEEYDLEEQESTNDISIVEDVIESFEDEQTEAAEDDPKENQEIASEEASDNTEINEEEYVIISDGYHELIEEEPFPVVRSTPKQMQIQSLGAWDSLPVSYNSTEDFHVVVPEYMPSLRDQGSYGTCWAFTSLGLGEIYMKKYKNLNLDLSELHLAYFSYNYQPDPLGGTSLDKNWATYDSKYPTFMERGGNLNLTQNILASWIGAADESLVPYETARFAIGGGINPDYAYRDSLNLTNYYNVNIRSDSKSVKELIIKNGAVGASYYHDASMYNGAYNSYYTKETTEKINHAITIVGWNDNFPASHFNDEAEGNGAWLVRNSWNTANYLEDLTGYFWLSYYDKSLHENGFSFVFEEADNYDNNYHYDGAAISGAFSLGTTVLTGANVFHAKADEQGEILKAVSVAIPDTNVNYKVDIYLNPTDEMKPDSGTHISHATTTGNTTYAGYYTIPLKEEVLLKKGDTFAVVVQLSTVQFPDAANRVVHFSLEVTSDQGWIHTTAATEEGQSFYLKSGNWQDNSSKKYGNFRIKAFTTNLEGSSLVLLDDFSFSEEIDKMHLLVGENQKAQIVFQPENATDKNIRWASKDNGVAEVTEDGTVTGVNEGSTEIIAFHYRNGQISMQKSFPVKVSKLLWTNALTDLKVGEETILSYETSIGDAVPLWQTSNEDVLSVNESGNITAKAPGQATITLTIDRKSISKTIQVQENDPTDTSQNDELEANQDNKTDYENTNSGNAWGDVLEEDRISKGYALPENIPQGFWTSELENYTYSGKACTQIGLRVYRGKKLLTLGTDYSVKYTNNVNAGEATLTVLGKGNYSGMLVKHFTIQPLDISEKDKVSVSASKLQFTFNNKLQKGKVDLYHDIQGKIVKLKNGKDYTLSYPKTDAKDGKNYDPNAFIAEGNYSIIVQGNGNYCGVINIEEQITKNTLMKVLSYKIENANYDYSGGTEECYPKSIVVKNGDKILKGYKISAADTEEDAINIFQNLTNSMLPDKEEYDYIYYATNHQSIGIANLVIIGLETHGYTGSVVKTYKVTGRSLTKANFSKELTATYHWFANMPEEYHWSDEGPVIKNNTVAEASFHEPSVTFSVSKSQRENLRGVKKTEFENLKNESEKKNYDYTYEYIGNTEEIGTVSIIFTGLNGYSGSVTKKYTIIGTAMKNVSIVGIKNSYEFMNGDIIPAGSETGTDIPEEFEVFIPKTKNSEKKLLEKNKDYTVSYLKNKNAGTAAIIITGKNGYSGVIKKTFKIKPYNILQDSLLEMPQRRITIENIGDVPYTKGGVKPIPIVKDGEHILKNNIDFTLNFSNNKAANRGEAIVTIKGKGNYTGSVLAHFTIGQADISKAKMLVGDVVCQNKPGICKPAITITDADNGSKLVAGTDYDTKIRYYYCENDNTKEVDESTVILPGTNIKAVVSGINNFYGTIEKTFRYVKADIAKAKVKISNQEYTGESITLEKDQISVYLNNQMVEPENYEIIGYENNINLGTAKVTIVGANDLGGFQTVSFKIVPKSLYYQIEFQANGGTGLMKSISVSGDEVQLPPNAFKNGKKVFSGWNTSQDGMGQYYADQQKISAIGKRGQKLVLYAMWEQADTILLNAYEIRQEVGTKFQLEASLQPDTVGDKTIQWVSENKSIASVDEVGLVALHKKGTTCILAKSLRYNTYAACVVIVDGPEEIGKIQTLNPENIQNKNDATDEINQALQNLNTETNTLYLEAGTYSIDATKGICPKSNTNLILAEGAVLQALPNNRRGSEVIKIIDKKNITISGGKIIGERNTHKPSGHETDEWGMGISLSDSENIVIQNMEIRDCNGDGIYLGTENGLATNAGCKTIFIDTVTTDHNRRNNISVVCATDVIINNCTITNAHGTAPHSGINIEPNDNDTNRDGKDDGVYDPCRRITINNCNLSGNGVKGNKKEGYGIVMNNPSRDVRIQNCNIQDGFINISGRDNIFLADTTIIGEINSREPITRGEGVIFQGYPDKEDVLVAEYMESRDSYSINASSFTLSAITQGIVKRLKQNRTYRFEYKVRGKGKWYFKCSNTGGYDVLPKEDKAYLHTVTMKADVDIENTAFQFTQSKIAKDNFLDIIEFRVYELSAYY